MFVNLQHEYYCQQKKRCLFMFLERRQAGDVFNHES